MEIRFETTAAVGKALEKLRKYPDYYGLSIRALVTILIMREEVRTTDIVEKAKPKKRGQPTMTPEEVDELLPQFRAGARWPGFTNTWNAKGEDLFIIRPPDGGTFECYGWQFPDDYPDAGSARAYMAERYQG